VIHNGKYTLLTNIHGPEDEFGDMDFKVAGTEGVTATQAGVKVDGIPIFILSESLKKAGTGRLSILKVIDNEISKSIKNISTQAPNIVSLTILPAQIELVVVEEEEASH
jgi:polyribonucleotide nucleotidyltransferase